ncbi:lysine--tRNA ligase-like [Artemia franciscana]|uniref:lysine--tRNA ligase-like n=1 Tax=Artemia franciscana TaxID=6661 RepID=UPI0032DAFE04
MKALQKKYFQLRRAVIQAAKSDGTFEPYPHKFKATTSLPKFVEKYNQLDVRQSSKEKVSVAGRIHAVRESEKKLFYDLRGNMTTIQVIVDARSYQSVNKFFDDVKRIGRGDIIGCVGYPCKTEKGELSIRPEKIELLSPCLYMLPRCLRWEDAETHYRQRYLDLLIKKETVKKFHVRSRIISYIRRFLDDREFLEVETPMMGATAKPLVTHHNEHNSKMFTRIALELCLKMLAVGGIDRAYELGKVFRNESTDLTHNPEFTTCELFMAYADYEDLMSITEDMLSGMVKSLYGKYKINYQPKGPDGPIQMDFTPPFRRMAVIPELEKKIKQKLPHPSTLDSPEAVEILDQISTKHGIKCLPPRTAARLLDKLVGHFLEKECTNPTFIIDHPQVMSPLAKYHTYEKGLSERFDLFVNKMEICKAYTELNDPFVQRERFAQQAKDKADGDDEAQMVENDICIALEHGLPPTGRWGMGIDRISMLLTNSCTIKEILLFPRNLAQR